MSACGGEDPLEGVYATASYQIGDCDTQADEPFDPIFTMTVISFFGEDVLTLDSCATEDMCDRETIFLDNAWVKDGGIWVGGSTSTSGTPGSCMVSLQRSVPEETADGIRIVEEERSGTLALSSCGDEASTEEAQDRYTELTCDAKKILVGTRQ